MVKYYLYLPILFLILVSQSTIANRVDPLEAINVPQAWEISTGSPDITVAVVDSGILWGGQLSTSNRWENSAEIVGISGVDDDDNGYIDDFYGIDRVDYDSDPSTHNGQELTNYHGTWIANILASSHDQEAVSIAPSILIQNIRILDDGGSGGLISIEEAVDYATSHSVDIISFSLLTDVDLRDSIKAALKRAVEAGIVIVAPRYNYGTGMFDDEFSHGMVAVSPTGDARYYDRNTDHPHFFIYAPSVNIPTFNPNGSPNDVTGVSFAIPLVTGTLALMKSVDSTIPSKYLPYVLQYSSSGLNTTSSGDPNFLDTYQSVANWQQFRDIDFDQDGISSGDELSEGSNPFDPLSTKIRTISIGVMYPGLSILVIISIMMKKRTSPRLVA